MKLEICTTNIQSVFNACEGRADRVELCSALSVGGLTPSIGLVEESCKIEGIETHVLIRPREGNFVYNEHETEMMIRDIEQAKSAGANGVVLGVLNENQELDLEVLRRLVETTNGMEKTFHRAFDEVVDPFKAMEQIIELGFNRILTSGQASNAFQGSDLIQHLVRKANKQITIMPGAGINSTNILALAEATGAKEFHMSATKFSDNRKDQFSMGKHRVSNLEEIRKVRDLLDGLP